MALGAIYSWAYLPDVQRVMVSDSSGRGRYLDTKNLEELGEGREKAKRGGEVITIKDKWTDIRRRRRVSLSARSSPGSREQQQQQHGYAGSGEGDIGMR